jgi:hypothetical protein
VADGTQVKSTGNGHMFDLGLSKMSPESLSNLGFYAVLVLAVNKFFEFITHFTNACFGLAKPPEEGNPEGVREVMEAITTVAAARCCGYFGWLIPIVLPFLKPAIRAIYGRCAHPLDSMLALTLSSAPLLRSQHRQAGREAAQDGRLRPRVPAPEAGDGLDFSPPLSCGQISPQMIRNG